LLHDKSLRPEIRVHILNVLAAAALKDDVILLLHQDRREHVLMNYAHDVDRLSVEEQEALALFVSLSYYKDLEYVCN
jgi:molybdopterin-guanine dinucleotide biosynthesis protein A